MCIFLTRHFSCVKDGATVTHTYQYLVRCANPYYADCIADGALPKMTERYNISCHGCSGRWHHPTVEPSAVECSPAENEEAVHRASLSYIRGMCRVIIMSSYPRWPEMSDESKCDVYGCAKEELACRFNKDHFSNGNFCDCSYTNQHPEFHNISAAQRQVIARCYLLPWEHQDTAFTRAEYTFPGKEEHAFELDLACCMQNQPGLSALDYLKAPTTIGDIEVLDFFVEPWNWKARQTHLRQRFEADSRLRWGRRELWLKEINNPRARDPRIYARDPLPGHQHTCEGDFREKLVEIIFNLLAVDSGISPQRANYIALVHRIIMSPDLRQPSRDQRFDGVTERALMHLALLIPYPGHPLSAPSVGAAWWKETEDTSTAYHLRRNRNLRLDDEVSRLQAIENAVVPLAREEVDALEEPDCMICLEAMSYPGEPHAAVALNCPARHRVGMNCWMRSQLRSRYVDTGRVVRCPLCRDSYPLGPWPAPINMDTVFGADHLRLPNCELNPPQRSFDF